MARQKRLRIQRQNRANRVRRRVRGSDERPRISVHRTLKHIYAQVIDDIQGRTVCSANSKAMGLGNGGNVAAAKMVGEELGRKAREAGVQQACFDRGAYRYHGRVRALADAVREAGVKF